MLAVLNDLVKVLRRHLENGEIVRFGDFGSFQIGVSSEGAESIEKFHSSMIKNPKVTFRPGIDLKEMLATLKYETARFTAFGDKAGKGYIRLFPARQYP